MYVSRAVESIREDPIAGESVSLVLETAEDADLAAVRAAAADAGATIERELQFEDLQVAVDQATVDAICAIDGLAAVQTADAIGTHPDESEEDLDLGDGALDDGGASE
jgi:hypothetical protein